MSDPKSIDVEVLPPRRERDQPGLSRLIAWLLDDLIPIPGTKFRVGLDPIIGLIPGIGDGSTTAVASLILLHAVRVGVPRIVLARMALNILLNALLGAIPGAGGVLSAFFKSNRRNCALLERHAGRGAVRASTRGDWIFVGALVGGVLAVAITASVVAVWIAWRLFQWFVSL